MENDFAQDIVKRAIEITLLLSAPMLIGALVVGILVSLFQAVTQINEQTLSFIPKMVVIIAALIICAPWMSETLVSFTRDLIVNIPSTVAGR